MKTSFYHLLFLLSLSVFISSCAKKGCTDPLSTNYDSSAKSSDGSCSYQGKVIFWFDQTKADDFIANGTTSLTYKMDGVVVGTSGTNVIFASAPDCGANGAVTVTKNLGGSLSKSYALTVTDQDGNTVYTATITLAASTTSCFQVQLI